MSEWEEFSAYRNLIKDAKREEREEIIASLEKGMNYLADAVRNRQMDIVPGVERYRRIIEELRARGESK